MKLYIDHKNLINDNYHIAGHIDAVAGIEPEIKVLTPEGEEVCAQISAGEDNGQFEFTVTADCQKYPRIMVLFAAGGEQASASFSALTLERELLSGKQRLKKAAARFKDSKEKKEYLHKAFIYNSRFMDFKYSGWYKKHKASEKELEAEKKQEFSYSPLISLIVPVYKPRPLHLKMLARSVLSQTYKNWQLILVNGSGEDEEVSRLVKAIRISDERIKTIRLHKNLGISGNTNIGIQESDGEWIAFADQDDVLAPNAFFEYVRAMNGNAQTDAIYCDEDKIRDKDGKHFAPNFKPDFNPALLLCSNYICHMFMVRKSILDKVGYLRSEFDGSQDHDLILRCTPLCRSVLHIPKVLYSWRAHAASTAESGGVKEYTTSAGIRAVEQAYAALGINARVSATEYPGLYRTDFELKEKPLVSIIIPNKDHIEDLKRCIYSIKNLDTYKNIEILIVENNSENDETFAAYEELASLDSRIRVVGYEGSFNFAAINNLGAQNAKGEYLLLLNNDTELISPDLITSMAGYMKLPGVGIVGPRLLYPDRTIQHAGLLIGIDGAPHHVFLGRPAEDPGYMTRAIASQNMSGVTAACMLIKKSLYDLLGGMDERFVVAYNDVDLCLQAEKAGYLCVYDAFVSMIHYESSSRGYELSPAQKMRFEAERDLLQDKWGERLSRDPYYNPNLSLRWGYYNLP
ncbi:MAG: glycosyltransferase family 2 protein [Lachnospiraceae bacterium]|nr:glycosyltransferase family 2 protein [Lachnospiraceae bacterium]